MFSSETDPRQLNKMSSFLTTVSQICVFTCCCQLLVLQNFSSGLAISNPSRWQQQTPTLLESHSLLTEPKIQNPTLKTTFAIKMKAMFYKSNNMENKLHDMKQLSLSQKTNYSQRHTMFESPTWNHNANIIKSLNYHLETIGNYNSTNGDGKKNIWPVGVSNGVKDGSRQYSENFYTGLSKVRRRKRSLQKVLNRSLRSSNSNWHHHRNRRHPVEDNKRGYKFRFGNENETNRKVKLKTKQNRSITKHDKRNLTTITTTSNNNNKGSAGKQKQNDSRLGDHKFQHSSKSGTVCHICNMKRIDKEARLKKLKVQILKQIGLTEFPNVTARQRISQVPVLRQLIENMSMQRDEPQWKDLPNDYELSYPEHMIIIAEKPNTLPRQLAASSADDICYFNIGGKLVRSVIKEANLWLYLKKTVKSIKRSVVKIRIWNVTTNTKREKPLKSIKLNVSNYGQWIKLKVTSIVKFWVKNIDFNYGLNITAVDSFGDSRIWTPAVPGHNEEYPVMDITFSHQKHGRQRRTISNKCRAKEPLGRCCLYPLTVDFIKMKWEWVLYPQTFEANYCSGNCSYDMIDDSFPNTYIGFKSGLSVNDIPCCTSTNESVLQILYLTNKNKLIHTHLKDIIVNTCGCR